MNRHWKTVANAVHRGFGFRERPPRKGKPGKKILPESTIRRMLDIYVGDETVTVADIGRRFGVSERAVFRYAKCFGVKPPLGVTFYRIRRGLKYQRLS